MELKWKIEIYPYNILKPTTAVLLHDSPKSITTQVTFKTNMIVQNVAITLNGGQRTVGVN